MNLIVLTCDTFDYAGDTQKKIPEGTVCEVLEARKGFVVAKVHKGREKFCLWKHEFITKEENDDEM